MLYESEAGNITIALAGDVMLTRRVSMHAEPGFLGVKDLFETSHATFANLESPVRHPHEGTPGVTTGTHMTTPPELLAELGWLGVDLVSTANNHASDFGEGGIEATISHLRRAGLPFAGTGFNLAAAQAPAYLDTARGRIGLVATTATFRPWNRAGGQGPDMQGRPGVNTLGASTIYEVDAESFSGIARAAGALGFEKARKRDLQHFYSEKDLAGSDAETVTLAGQTFRGAERFNIVRTVDGDDLERNLRAIREARRQSDFVIFSLHSHEVSARDAMQAESRSEFSESAEFVRAAAHAAIDAGADIVAGHGSHTLLGIEIYKGRPILYSLGNLIFMNETITGLPADAYRRFDLPVDAGPADFLDARTDNGRKGHPAHADYWRAAIATCRFEAGRLRGLDLHPIDLGFGRPRSRRGRPSLAHGETASRIIERIRRLSAPFGTTIAERDGTAVVEVP